MQRRADTRIGTGQADTRIRTGEASDPYPAPGQHVFDRRGFIRLTAGGLLVGVALPLLEACAPSVPPAQQAGGAGAAPAATTVAGTGASAAAKPTSTFPSFYPATTGPKPDFASAGPQYEDGFSNYPTDNPKSWTKAPPGTGSNVIIFSQARGVGSNTPPVPYDQNPAWKEINKQLNANVQFSIAPAADYGTKLAAIMAGGDLPDIIFFQGGLGGTNATSSTVGASATTNLPAFLQHSMADLTPYLAGDAIKDYPNLAAIPTFAWKNSGCAYDGHLYMWPVERYRPLNMMFRNTGIWDKELGDNYVPKNADDFKRVLVQLNRPKEDRAAIIGTNIQYNLQVFPAMFGAANNWGLDASGKLVKDIETPQYKEAVGYIRDLFAAGLYQPDFINTINAATSTAATNAFAAGKGASIVYTFGVNWSTLWVTSQAAKPPVSFLPIGLFPAHDGGTPGHFLGPGFIATNAMKKGSPDRIQELLRLVDWMAAPFGSQEDLLLTYGLKDVEYTLDAAGHPVQMPGKAAETQSVPWQYVVQHPQVMFFPNYADYAKLEYDAEHALIPAGIEDPTWGLVSPALSTAGPSVSQLVLDTLTDIIVGRRDLSEYDQMVKDWQTKGGNQVRTELQQALAASG
jgi:putative aldouronate transport system substrate-binding protein